MLAGMDPASNKAWELTDDLWERVGEFVPQRKRDENKTYQRKPGVGRKPIPPRLVKEKIERDGG
jgi:hypothetical protein